MSDSFPIGPDGHVVLPKIGRYDIASKTPEEASAEILEGLNEYLRNPSIGISFLRRINILGAVREPGLYPVDLTMTVADALALAGGTLPNGKTDELQIIRGDVIVTALLRRGARLADTPIRSGDELYVPERSWFARNTGLVASLISATVSLAIAMIYVSGGSG